MMLFSLFSAAAFVALIAWAAISDLRSYRIPNAVSVGLVTLFSVTGVALGAAWPSHLLAGLIALGLGLVLYRFDIVGGGDVKLIAAVALWAGADWQVFVLALSIATMTFALAVLAARKVGAELAADGVASTNWPRMLRRGEQLPFAVTIAVAAMMMIARSPLVGVL